jgi:hypothetical protein
MGREKPSPFHWHYETRGLPPTRAFLRIGACWLKMWLVGCGLLSFSHNQQPYSDMQGISNVLMHACAYIRNGLDTGGHRHLPGASVSGKPHSGRVHGAHRPLNCTPMTNHL